MALSVLDLFSIGIGPSSSHTVGPMRAARRFTDSMGQRGVLGRAARVHAELFGSLAATGVGHGSDTAVLLGLAGQDPETIDPDACTGLVEEIVTGGRLPLDGRHEIAFDRQGDLTLHMRESLPGHPNGMRLTAYDDAGEQLHTRDYYSVGGGFVVTSDELEAELDATKDVNRTDDGDTGEPYPFSTGAELAARCHEAGLSIAELMLANEATRHDLDELRTQLLAIWAVMEECVHNGVTRTEPILPGGLKVRRRAPALREHLLQTTNRTDPMWAMEWVNLFALAVNEENASGGRIVTAPTNGAAGIIPAVMLYYMRFVLPEDATQQERDDKVVEFLLTAAAIGILYKRNASISGAEVGCQGEVGSACSMAAGALCAVLGGTVDQVENAAEIGIEHNLGLTCDPVGGLVQVPCIERNAIASVKAINAARLALLGDGSHRVTLDQAITTMRDTGADMKSKYKETSRGGLAVNVIEC
ncbi:L-serine dehydratase [Micrococcus sp. KT16]|uniref:L-serine ammonia-lyase n=1 Tax=Micrococcus sp. KT16 TaxID=2184005 RepID=UPI000DE811CF|nr:L-serine ammonia-lyase [Micrococcus sp. KT16]RBO88190.1 L-serine dehydratase [Micrococcus sp. KT16]